MSLSKNLKKLLDDIAENDELGYTPDARATAELLIEYHGEAAEQVLTQALDIVRKYKKR